MEKPELKTVMSWLEVLAQNDWQDFHSDSEVQNIAKSALALLKDQANDIHHMGLIIESHEKELKEQENEIDTLKTLVLGYENGSIKCDNNLDMCAECKEMKLTGRWTTHRTQQHGVVFVV